MPASHMLFLGVSLAVILTLFVVASRPPDEADLEYRPPAPAVENERPPAVGIDDDQAGTDEHAADRTAPARPASGIKPATATRP